VSPLLRDEWQLVLSPSQVLMARARTMLTRRGLQRRLLSHAMADCPGAEPGKPAWTGALATLEQQLHGMPIKRASLQIVLSNRFVRYALIPWQAGLHGAREDAAYVRHYFAQMFGGNADDWDICVSGAPDRQPRLASAIDAALLAALRDLCALAGLRLSAVSPQLSITFNRYRRSLPSSGWIVLVESGCLCLGLFEDGRWLAIRTMRTDAGWQEDLPALLEREACLANPAGAADQVFLWAPEQAADTLAQGRFRLHQLLAPLPVGAEEWYAARFACGAGR
jgi:hypothetical protein